MKMLYTTFMTRSLTRLLAFVLLSIAMFGAQSLAMNCVHAAAIVESSDNVISLENNRSLLIRLDANAANIFIANPNIADVQIKSPRLIYVFGKSAGETTFYAVDENDNVIYSANVEVTHNIERLQETLNQILPEASITVHSVNGLVLLTGFAQSPEEADTAQRMVYEMLSQSRLGSGQLQEQRVINQIRISTPNQVNLRVKVAEMSRNTLKSLGFNWEAALITAGGGSILGFAQGNNVFDIVENPANEGTFIKEFITGANSFFFDNVGGRHDVSAVIDALETEGFLSVLAEPNITAISGETASFLAGGEFPIPIPQTGLGSVGGITIEFKQFGVQLQFTPTVLSENRINLKVAPEVSQLSSTGSVTVNSIVIPALSTRRAITTVELASGESFAIAGLLENSTIQNASKFPWLGDIPILGTLFRSDSFTHQETELVIIVTPYIVRGVNSAKLMGPTDINHIPEDTGYYIKGRRSLAGDGGLKVDK